jgi:hypothetical protein
LQKDVTRPQVWRSRLEVLLRTDRARLWISPIHLGELALRRELYAHAFEALATLPNVYLVTCRTGSVFRAELEREDIVFDARRFDAVELRNLDLTTRWGGVEASGFVLARIVKGIARIEASAKNLGKRAHKVDRPAKSKATKKHALHLLRGEIEAFPSWSRPAVAMFSRYAPRVLNHFGRSVAEVERVLQQEERGLGWTASLAPNARLPRKNGKKWIKEDVESMPATVLRACVERVDADPRRPTQDSTSYDVAHLAYLAYSEYGTVDSANLNALKPALALLPKLHVFGTGNLDPLLDALDNRAEQASEETL